MSLLNCIPCNGLRSLKVKTKVLVKTYKAPHPPSPVQLPSLPFPCPAFALGQLLRLLCLVNKGFSSRAVHLLSDGKLLTRFKSSPNDIFSLNFIGLYVACSKTHPVSSACSIVSLVLDLRQPTQRLSIMHRVFSEPHKGRAGVFCFLSHPLMRSRLLKVSGTQ